MPDLTTPQLEAIQRLISEPLRQAVRAEMQAGHERLAGTIEKVAQNLADHISHAATRQRDWDAQLLALDRRVTALERFRGKVLLVYGALVVLISAAWSLVREWLVAGLRKR